MGKRHVMIIDDDPFTIQLYNTIIETISGKEHVTTVISAVTALDMLDDLHRNDPDRFPDYLVLDLRMPEMHGFEFIRNFNEKYPEQSGKTKFIITTSSVSIREKEEALGFKNVQDYLIKPIPMDYLEKLIKEGLSQGNARMF